MLIFTPPLEIVLIVNEIQGGMDLDANVNALVKTQRKNVICNF